MRRKGSGEIGAVNCDAPDKENKRAGLSIGVECKAAGS